MPLGFIAVLAGWTVTEVGRQPWLVFGHLHTADAVTPSLTTADVAVSLTVYVLAFAVLMPALYFPVLLMLLGLLFRGVAFEHRETGAACVGGWLLGVLLFIALISVWTPLVEPRIAERCFGMPQLLWLAPVPLLTALLAFALWRALQRRHDLLPFLCSIGLFVLSFLGLAISLWPCIIPPTLTLWDAAAAPKSQAFMRVGTVFLLPVILLGVAWSYWVLRGKVLEPHAYHGH